MGDEYTRTVPLTLFEAYNIFSYQTEHPNENIGQNELNNKRWSRLSRGEYYIGVKTEVVEANTKEKVDLSTEIKITIK